MYFQGLLSSYKLLEIYRFMGPYKYTYWNLNVQTVYENPEKHFQERDLKTARPDF